ncbi:hypothetical protein [Endozoicomonas sp. ONNA1]|uniref:hypothetical protein n=1 Tax=Endozoicomonas sp. ONNA1 TaxID=2828740 RepID=UPI00214903DB|nr:hypothetical protein [Endozoicomonas sp. ONNA1]
MIIILECPSCRELAISVFQDTTPDEPIDPLQEDKALLSVSRLLWWFLDPDVFHDTGGLFEDLIERLNLLQPLLNVYKNILLRIKQFNLTHKSPKAVNVISLRGDIEILV